MTPPVDDNFSSQPKDAGVGQPPRDLHPTSDIRFVIVEVSKLTERVDNLERAIEQEDARDEKRADKTDAAIEKLEGKIDSAIEKLVTKIDATLGKLDTKIDDKAKELADKLEGVKTGDLQELKTSATFVKGYLAGLTFAGLVIGYLFHDQLQHIAEAVAKLGK